MHMNKTIRFLKERLLIATTVSAILPGLITAAVEYIMTGGHLGWTPIWASCIGGLVAWIVLMFILPEPLESSETRRLPNPLDPSEPPTEERFFSPRTPAELVASIYGLTDVKAEAMAKFHIGHWLKVEGKIINVSLIQSFSHKTTMVFIGTSNEEELFLSLEFDSRIWNNRVSSLDIGEPISAIGKIKQISSIDVRLAECELVNETGLCT